MFYVSFVLNITKHKAFRLIFLCIPRKHFQKASGMLSLNPYNFSGFRYSFWSQQVKTKFPTDWTWDRWETDTYHFGIISNFVLKQIIAHNRKKCIVQLDFHLHSNISTVNFEYSNWCSLDSNCDWATDSLLIQRTHINKIKTCLIPLKIAM